VVWYVQRAGVVTIKVYVQPGAKCTEIVGLHADSLKIRLNAPPIEGRANDALLKLVAHLFDVPKQQIALKRGVQSKYKTITISGSLIDPRTLVSQPLN
jgi:uncharacterized protein (TIGR00251 family)